MSDPLGQVVPVWTLTTEMSKVPMLPDEDRALTPERLSELRSALSSFANAPVVTLEAHPLPVGMDRSTGLPLDSLSPLAQELGRLISTTTGSPAAQAAVKTIAQGETLYRMVVPAKLATQVGNGLFKSMPSKAVTGGVHGAFVNAAGKIAGQATLVPVEAAAAGAATGAAGTAAVGVATAGALTVAAPLVLMAIAVGVSAYADQKRQEAIQHITELVEKLGRDNLESEQSELDGCRGAIDKATAILLDQGKIGHTLGIDTAVNAIDKAVERAQRRAQNWEASLSKFGDQPVEVPDLERVFPGVTSAGGEFRAHLELAMLAIALKRRVAVLQAVEHGQSDPQNPFENFVRSLKSDQRYVDEVEANLTSILFKLSTLELRSPSRLVDKLMTRGQVDDLLEDVYQLRKLGRRLPTSPLSGDVAIDVIRERDGSVVVLPPSPA